MSNQIKRTLCPACKQSELRSLPQWRMKKLHVDKACNPLMLCRACALELATTIFVMKEQEREMVERALAKVQPREKAAVSRLDELQPVDETRKDEPHVHPAGPTQGEPANAE